MACLNESNDKAEGGQQKDRSLELHAPAKVSPHSVLGVVLAARFGPDGICLIETADALAVCKEG